MGTTFGLHPPQPNPHKPGRDLSPWHCAAVIRRTQKGQRWPRCARAGDRYIHSKFEKKKVNLAALFNQGLEASEGPNPGRES